MHFPPLHRKQPTEQHWAPSSSAWPRSSPAHRTQQLQIEPSCLCNSSKSHLFNAPVARACTKAQCKCLINRFSTFRHINLGLLYVKYMAGPVGFEPTTNGLLQVRLIRISHRELHIVYCIFVSLTNRRPLRYPSCASRTEPLALSYGPSSNLIVVYEPHSCLKIFKIESYLMVCRKNFS